MTANYYLNKEVDEHYGLKLFAGLILLLLILAYTSSFAIQNYYSNALFSSSSSKHKVYFLKSKNLENMYDKYDMNYGDYEKRIAYFDDVLDDYGYDVSEISSEKLGTIDKNSILLVLDMMSLSSSEIAQIDAFVRQGGNIIFNFTSGFLSPSLVYQKNNLVSTITDLRLSPKHNTIKFKKSNSAFLSARLLSPLSKYIPEGKGLDIPLYDAVPIYKTKHEADAYLTNWLQSNYPKIDKNHELDADEGGAIWHGSRGKGKWVYFSFPSYVFSQAGSPKYEKLFHGMLDYVNEKMTVMIYPYIDARNGVFVSEDTEYKFENIKQFNRVSKKYHFPVTAFCVAKLALQHKKLMHTVAKNNLLEIGSHSYSHKKIVGKSDEVYERETVGSKKVLSQFTKQELIGFRAPREELDEKMMDLLKGSKFTYTLGMANNRLYPTMHDGMLKIYKHATDDYSYLINLDWSSSQVLTEMKKEVNVITKLDGLYTLSTHTHLMSFGSNIKITDHFLGYVKKQKQMTPLNGRMIYDRVTKRLHISTQTKVTDKNLVLTISNDNRQTVKNLHYEITVNPNIKLKGIESEIIGLKTKLVKKSSTKYVLTVKTLNPKSQIVLFVHYVQSL